MNQTVNRRLEVAVARAEFLAGGDDTQEVRPLIAASWQRSRTAGVNAHAPTSTFHGDLDLDGRLMWAARPTVDRLADESAELALSIAVTDAHSRLLMRVDTEHRIGRLLDAVSFAPGFDYGENAVGTNGVGTASESRQAVSINGPEHFLEKLQPFSCTGAPIRDPLSGRVEGILDITCLFEDSTPILRSLVRSAAGEIELALLRDRGHDQQAVFDAFTRLNARTRSAVGAVGLSTLLTNQELHEQFTGAELDEIRTHARYLADGQDRAEDAIALSTGAHVRVRALRVSARDRTVGVAFEVSREQSPAPRIVTASGPAAGGQRTPGWRRAVSEATSALAAGTPVLVVGEESVGKATLLVDGFRSLHPDGRIVEVSSAAQARALADTRLEASVPTLCLVRRIDRWDPADAREVVALIDRVGAPHAVAATFAGETTGDDGGPLAVGVASADDAVPSIESPSIESPSIESGVLAAFEACTIVPPLRHREQDLPVLVTGILRALGVNRPVAPAAMRLLGHQPWPGNLGELRDVLRTAAGRRPAGPIEAHDLPGAVSSPLSRRLSTMETVERDAIVAALREADDNRLRAAELLGISRATLYRKLRQYSLGT